MVLQVTPNWSLNPGDAMREIVDAVNAAVAGRFPEAPMDGKLYGRMHGNWTAASGLQGPQGPAGPQGPQGLEGPPGPEGPVGPQGDMGPQGIPGAVGPKGDPGQTGAQGAAGSDGVAGIAGSQGPQGQTGPQGSQGPKGDQGAQGIVGPQGAQGAAGARGPAGPTAVSTDAGNLAKLGADSLLLVPSTVPSPLTVKPSAGAATLTLDKAAGGVVNAVRGSTNGVQLWEMDLGDATAQGGSNAGSNFTLNAYSDTGVLLGSVMTSARSTQVASFAQKTVQGSDQRWKENITPLTDALATVLALSGVTYTIVGDPAAAQHAGFIAQQVQQVVPRAVINTGSQSLYGTTYDNALGVSYDDITALLVEAIKAMARPMPACVVSQEATQAIAKNTPTKILYDTAEHDTTSAFDLANSRFQPTVAGFYQINCGCGLQAGSVSSYNSVYKNGAEYRRSTTSDGPNTRMSTLVYLNGTTDYAEGFVYSAGNFSTSTGGVLTSFSAALVQAAAS